MALYTIGDLHLSFSSDKPMDIFGGNWINYIDKIKTGLEILKPDDVCVFCGDTSWGMSLDESFEDFKFLDNYPGRKIIIKGNHDYWWNTVTKIKKFFEDNDIKNFDILHNNAFIYEDTAICGTRGWANDDAYDPDFNARIIARETNRLRTSLKAADDIPDKICFFHYPPLYKNEIYRDFIDVMNEFGVKHCLYGHIHGDGFKNAVTGEVDGIFYDMVSADYINFTPKKLLQ